jgi:hypothetical protein
MIAWLIRTHQEQALQGMATNWQRQVANTAISL